MGEKVMINRGMGLLEADGVGIERKGNGCMKRGL